MASTKSLLFRHRQLAPTASVRVSPICLGSMTFGLVNPERYGKITKQETWNILDHYFENGGNFIDTANAYQYGQSEVWLGEWIKERNCRDQIVLATKYSNSYQLQEPPRIQSNCGGNGVKSMRLSLENSLKSLQTSYVDLFYVHWWDFTVTIPELMHNLNDLCAAGKVLYLGISDCPAWVVTKANQYARGHGLRQFVVYQGMWNASMRDFERDIIPMCRDEGMGICPYGVLNQGRFQTKKGYEEREKGNDGRNFIPLSQHDKDVAAVLERVSEKKGCDLLQVAMAYVLQKTPYVFPIIGVRKVEHIKGSIAGLAVTLTEDEVAEIETAYKFDPGFPHTFLSGTLFAETAPKGAYKPGDVFLTKNLGEFDWVEASRPIGLDGK